MFFKVFFFKVRCHNAYSKSRFFFPVLQISQKFLNYRGLSCMCEVHLNRNIIVYIVNRGLFKAMYSTRLFKRLKRGRLRSRSLYNILSAAFWGCHDECLSELMPRMMVHLIINGAKNQKGIDVKLRFVAFLSWRTEMFCMIAKSW